MTSISRSMSTPGLPRYPCKQRPRLERLEHSTSQSFVQRRKAQSAIAEDFGRGPAHADHDHRPEDGVLLRSQQQFETIGVTEHLLKRDAR